MPENIQDELIHITCTNCGKITSLSYASIADSPGMKCPYCDAPLPLQQDRAHDEAVRKAQELDAGPDALGSHE